MSLFHTHKWVEVSRDYTPPEDRFFGLLSREMSLQLLSGTTHIYFKCKECGDIKQKDVIGNYQGEK